jgi:hypothetical protein
MIKARDGAGSLCLSGRHWGLVYTSSIQKKGTDLFFHLASMLNMNKSVAFFLIEKYEDLKVLISPG